MQVRQSAATANAHAGGGAAEMGSDTAKAMASVDHAVASRRVSVAVLGGHAEGHARGKFCDKPYRTGHAGWYCSIWWVRCIHRDRLLHLQHPAAEDYQCSIPMAAHSPHRS